MQYIFFIVKALLFSLTFFIPFVNAMEDSAYENRLHNIYLKHYKDPVSYQDWSAAVSVINSDTYQLKHKDTLWDLSEGLLKNNLYWSKLWVANKHIKNPHRILKGDSIKWKEKDLVAVNHSKHSVDILAQFQGVKIPESIKKPTLTENSIPSSLPYLKSQNLNSVPKQSIVFKKSTNQFQERIPVSFYLSDENVPSIGRVVRKNGFGSISFNGEQVIVNITGYTPQEGSFFTLFTNEGSFNLLNTTGYEIFIKGEIKILHSLPGGDSLYLAEVVKSINPIQKGDLISIKKIPTYSTSSREVGDVQDGSIIGTPHSVDQPISLYSFVYLNKGKEDGVREGNIYYIRANEKYHAEDSYFYPQLITGKIKIVHSSLNSSTAVVIYLTRKIHIGDFFGNSQRQTFRKGSEIIDDKVDIESEEDTSDVEAIEEFETEGASEEFEEEELSEEDAGNVETIEEEEEEEEEEDLEEAEEEQEDLEEAEEDLEEAEEAEEEQEDLEEDIENEFEDFEEMEEAEDDL